MRSCVRCRDRAALLGGMVTAAAGWVGIVGSDARKKRKRKKTKKPKPNEFGCLEVGDLCKSADQCCSGIYEGKKGKRKCQAHGAGTCQPQPGFCLDSTSTLVPCNNTINCVCLRTTADSLFCADLDTSECAECKRDADCPALGFPPGSACVPVGLRACTGACESGMLCAAPCGTERPD